MVNDCRLAISWHRLPPYAARLISTGVKSIDESVEIIASKPPCLLKEVEQALGQPVRWIDTTKVYSWADLGMNTPEIFFQAGWLSKAFSRLGREVHQKGGKVVCFSDNSWNNSPRQWLGAVAFRVQHRQNFDAVWVPGHSGFKLCRFFGMPRDKIYQGMYGADPEIFASTVPLFEREKKFIFVGRLIERKGIALLVQAFREFHRQYPEWKLHIIGDGPLIHLLNAPGIIVEGFKPPDEVASIMRQSRFLILPSHKEHWGLVVHEAALSGCGLIVSRAIGASFDLVTEANGTIFSTGSVKSLYQALVKSACLSQEDLNDIFRKSQSLASKFGPQPWADTFVEIVTDCRKYHRPI